VADFKVATPKLLGVRWFEVAQRRCSLAAGALSMIYPIGQKSYNPRNHCISAEPPVFERLSEPNIAVNELSEIGLEKNSCPSVRVLQLASDLLHGLRLGR
jgi:hypothetical protein